MSRLPLALLALSLALPAPAQEKEKPPKQGKAEVGDHAGHQHGDQGQTQGPVPPDEVVHEPTPKERIAQLEKELGKLKEELAFVRRIAEQGGLPARVAKMLRERQLNAQSYLPATGPRPSVKSKGVRLMGDAEKAKLEPDVVFTVNGLPVTEAELQDAMDYLRSYPTELSEEQIARRAAMELVRLKAAQAAFPTTAQKARSKILQAKKLLAEGKPFEDVARELSECPSSSQGGDLGYFDRNTMDFFFTKEAFRHKVGQVTDVVATTFGYHLIKVTGYEKGKTPAEDRVKASHILALYYPDQTSITQVRLAVNNGEVDVAFRSPEDRDRYKPDELK